MKASLHGTLAALRALGTAWRGAFWPLTAWAAVALLGAYVVDRTLASRLSATVRLAFYAVVREGETSHVRP